MIPRAVIFLVLLGLSACSGDVVEVLKSPTPIPTSPPFDFDDYVCDRSFPTVTRSEIPDVPIYPNVLRPPYVTDLPDDDPEIKAQIPRAQRWIYFDTKDSFADVRRFYKEWAVSSGWYAGDGQGGSLYLKNEDACPFYEVHVIRYKVEDMTTTVQIPVSPYPCRCVLLTRSWYQYSALSTLKYCHRA